MHDVAVNCVRSKNAQKQLARTSLSESGCSLKFPCSRQKLNLLKARRAQKNQEQLIDLL